MNGIVQGYQPYFLVNNALPNLGESFFDLRFGTMITRTTNAK